MLLGTIRLKVRIDRNSRIKDPGTSKPSVVIEGSILDIPKCQRVWRGIWPGSVNGENAGTGFVLVFLDSSRFKNERNRDYTKDTIVIDYIKNGRFKIRSTQFGRFVGRCSESRTVEVVGTFLNQNAVFIPWKAISL